MAATQPNSTENSSFKQFDSWLFLALLTFSTISVLAVYSANVDSAGISQSSQWIKQIIWVVIGLTAFVLLSFFDYREVKSLSSVLWLGAFFSLLLVLLVGSRISGSKSWLGWGPLGIQPSELAKGISIIILATYFSTIPTGAKYFKNLLTGWMTIFPFIVLIMLQPDFGSAVVFLPIFFAVIYAAGARTDLITFIILTGILFVFYLLLGVWDLFIATKTVWFAYIFNQQDLLLKLCAVGFIIFIVTSSTFLVQKRTLYYILSFLALVNFTALFLTYICHAVFLPYQMMRLATFLDPSMDARGAGYQVLQSLTAIGSGGIFGKGYLQGTHSHLRYLPEQSTDFIFSIISEEFGLVGCTFIILLYVFLLLRLLYYASCAAEPFGIYLCVGTFGLILFHIMINVGMVMSLVPITGIPLFLISYGGSSTIMIMALLGLCANVYRSRYKN